MGWHLHQLPYLLPSSPPLMMRALLSARSPLGGSILPYVCLCFHCSQFGVLSLFDWPQLYSPSFVDSFNDVTNGTNPGCGTEGFRASPGWDPVTGLGTPNFERLLANFLQLP